MIDQIMEKKLVEMWHPTAELCYYVAFVFKEKLPREYGVIPNLLRMIWNMLPNSKLTELHLGGHQITDAVAMKLAEMLPSSKLTQLWLFGNKTTDAGKAALRQSNKNKDGKKINIYT